MPATYSATRIRLTRIAILAVVPAWLLMLFGSSAFKPGYSHVSQYISELNAIGTPHAWQIGLLGFVPFGLMLAAVLIVAAPLLPIRGIARVGYWILLLEAVAYIGSAFAPCDAGCPADGSLSQQLHNLLGLLTYLGTCVGVVLLACGTGLRSSTRAVLLVVAMLWLLLFFAMVLPPFEPIRGVLQRTGEAMLYSTLLTLAWRALPRR
ncbi:DUF998 domain-containing protein [Luteimonas sp. 3794]|uniref:DUF998 domain-containing protein n=1 Tax=Luteimonas sp. 3794 TaxID=2817730 RepID=UPI002863D660|nr:DUF998 domain-containing protein [Luteimonas sp. 3794]MDR6990633.1 putative membrane protein [Luteimonas sp. 3794]